MEAVGTAARLADAVEAFTLSKKAAGCSPRTVGNYELILAGFRKHGPERVADVTAKEAAVYAVGLRKSLRPSSAATHVVVLRVFFAWAVTTGLTERNPFSAVEVRAPRLLPRVPEADTVRRLLNACDLKTWAGRRNRALVGLLADSGLRIGEALRLRREDVRLGERTVAVRGGKGGKDRTAHIGAECAASLRAWMSSWPGEPEDFLFAAVSGAPLTRSHGTHILHHLSRKAKLPKVVGPHQLRAFCATSVLRQSGDLELTRQVLGHESLTMSLRYAKLAATDVARKFRKASPLDDLKAGQ